MVPDLYIWVRVAGFYYFFVGLYKTVMSGPQIGALNAVEQPGPFKEPGLRMH